MLRRLCAHESSEDVAVQPSRQLLGGEGPPPQQVRLDGARALPRYARPSVHEAEAEQLQHHRWQDRVAERARPRLQPEVLEILGLFLVAERGEIRLELRADETEGVKLGRELGRHTGALSLGARTRSKSRLRGLQRRLSPQSKVGFVHVEGIHDGLEREQPHRLDRQAPLARKTNGPRRNASAQADRHRLQRVALVVATRAPLEPALDVCQVGEQ
eukprot:scaffold32392_cov57-Phaeocystis_antarctica.AAC.1